MNKDKWLKWQIGVVGALAIGLLFQQVKGSAAFAKAQEQALASNSKSPDAYANPKSSLEQGFGGRANDGGQSNAPSQGNRGAERPGGQRSRMQADSGVGTNGSLGGNSGQNGSRSQNGSGSQGQVQTPQAGQQPDASAGSSRRQTRTGRS